jgi:DNA replication protein DnaC
MCAARSKAPSRGLEAILQSLKTKSAARSQTLAGTDSAPPVCRCSGRLFFVEQVGTARRFSICPRCNERRTCHRCRGSGHLEMPNLQTGQSEVIPFGCDCVLGEQRVALLNQAGIPEKYLESEFSFENVKHGYDNVPDSLRSKFTQNQRRIMEFCNQIHDVLAQKQRPGEKYFLTLVGPVGTGKTHFAVCALKDLIWQYGYVGRFVDFQSLLHSIRNAYTRKVPEDEIMLPLRDADILLIDELGKGRSENEWELEKLDDLINTRYNARKITIITTNYLTPDLQREAQAAEQKGRAAKKPQSLHMGTLLEDKNATHPTEGYWQQSLPERVGERMYDRILEVSLFVDFVGIPSFRKRFAQDFITKAKES